MGIYPLMRRRAALAAAAIALVAVGVLAVSGRTILAWILPGLLGLAIHGNVTASSVQIGNGAVIVRGLHATKNGDPLFDAAQVRVDYSLRDLLPGSRHRFGLLAISLDRPVFTLERRADGSYDLALGFTPASGPPAPTRLNAVPLAFRVEVRDGAIALRAPQALDPRSRAIDLRKLQLTGTIDTATRTHYRLTGAFSGSAAQAISVTGTIDATRGYAMHRVLAAALPLRAIANFFINNHAAQILSGRATGLDMRLYALGVEPEAPVDYHLGGG
ncbi:MAG TPA: hypothetical protein VMV65_00640, partial [Alphaproteobacteria bacterium]|nr:hypothetical protein [Alphaproteobacteria bacterium]